MTAVPRAMGSPVGRLVANGEASRNILSRRDIVPVHHFEPSLTGFGAINEGVTDEPTQRKTIHLVNLTTQIA